MATLELIGDGAILATMIQSDAAGLLPAVVQNGGRALFVPHHDGADLIQILD
jgi:hypothetical protein